MSKPTGIPAPPTIEQLHELLAEQIDASAYQKAWATLSSMLRLRPDEPELLEARGFLQEQLGFRLAAKQLRQCRGHQCYVNTVAVATKGFEALSGSGGELASNNEVVDGPDHSIRLWDLGDGKEIRSFKGHTSLVTSVAFVPSRPSYFLSASRGGTIALWDSSTGQVLNTIQRHKPPVWTLAAHGDQFLSGGDDKRIRLWNTHTGQRTKRLEGHTGTVTSLAFLPDGLRALSASLDRDIRLWDLDKGKCLASMQGHLLGIKCLAVRADGRLAASGGGDNTVRLWNLETGKEILLCKGHQGVVNCVIFTLDGQHVISGSSDRTIRVWDAHTGKELLCLTGHTDMVRCLAMCPDGQTFLSGSGDRMLKIWQLAEA